MHSSNFHAGISGCGYFPSVSPTCNSVTCTAPSAVIVSRNYPLHYDRGLDCRWNISTSVGTYIEVTFREFNISSPTTHCDEEYLEIVSSGISIRLCNANIEKNERRFKSDKNELTIHFKTDDDFETGSFEAVYQEMYFSTSDVSNGKLVLNISLNTLL